MQDSVRDAFMVALKLNGNSMNTLDETELAAARDLLLSLIHIYSDRYWYAG